MFSAAFLVQTLFGSAVFAIPTSKELGALRRQRRGGVTRQGKPVNLVNEQVIPGVNASGSHVEYSSNWAGAVLVASTVCFRCRRLKVGGTTSDNQHRPRTPPSPVLSLFLP